MAQSAQQRLEDVVMWSALLVYGAVWFYIPYTQLGVAEFAWVNWLLGAVYVAGHVYEIRYRGHCYLSADASAMPWAFTAALLLLPLLIFATDASWSEISKLGISFAVSFGGGHLAALLYSMLMYALLALVVPDTKE